MVRQGRIIALVVAFLIWCVGILMAGASGVLADTSKKEEARCEGTRKIDVNMPVRYTTNDLPGCPKGGLLKGTDKADELAGEKGDDEIRGLGGSDLGWGGDGNDVIYGGPGNDDSVTGDNGDDVIYVGPGNDKDVIGNGGDDVIYGGPGDDDLSGRNGNDTIHGGPGDDRLDGRAIDGKRDKLYCGAGQDTYFADKADYVDSSCEKKLLKAAHGPDPLPLCSELTGWQDVCRMPASPSASPFAVPLGGTGGPAVLLPAVALLLGSGILTYAILRLR